MSNGSYFCNHISFWLIHSFYQEKGKKSPIKYPGYKKAAEKFGIALLPASIHHPHLNSEVQTICSRSYQRIDLGLQATSPAFHNQYTCCFMFSPFYPWQPSNVPPAFLHAVEPVDFQQHEQEERNQAIKAIWKVTQPWPTLPGSPCMNTAGSLERKRRGMLVEMDMSRKKALPDAQERIKAARVPNWSANLVQKWYKVVRSGTMQVITSMMHPDGWSCTVISLSFICHGKLWSDSQKCSVPKRGLDIQRSWTHWVTSLRCWLQAIQNFAL